MNVCRSFRSVLLVALALCVTAPAVAQPILTREALEARAELLQPGDASAYFELGEEALRLTRGGVLDAARLARELLVLAVVQANETGEDRAVAASACLALAQLDEGTIEESWLRALAERLDGRRSAASGPLGDRRDSDRLAASRALALTRAGDGVSARRLLREPAVRELLRGVEALLRAAGGGGLAGVFRQSEIWPCPECGNERISRRDGGVFDLCHTCQGDPGRPLSAARLVAQLEAERRLLGVSSGEVLAGSLAAPGVGPPLREIDPSLLPLVFRVDPEARVRREGQWVVP
ncbi:MAG: hypothetical protein AAGG07_03720 [Planctomycetota bacterium]